jgi:hypothetical protein
MVGKAGRSGRKPAENPKRRQVGFRLDNSIGALFDACVADAAKAAPIGSTYTASDYLRGLFLKDAAARGLVPDAKPPSGPPAKPRPTAPKPKRSGKT